MTTQADLYAADDAHEAAYQVAADTLKAAFLTAYTDEDFDAVQAAHDAATLAADMAHKAVYTAFFAERPLED